MTTPTLGRVPWVIDSAPDPVRTMDKMASDVHDALNDPTIVRYANEVIENTRPRDYPGQIATIRDFLRRYFKFVNNPIGVQRIRTPADMLLDIERKGFVWGACDDAATLAATLGMANALPAQFRAVGFGQKAIPDPAAPLTHVIADLYDGADWCPLDVTKPDDMIRPPNIVRTLTKLV